MIEQNELIETNILDYLSQHENKEILRFLTCGSVDDGKSTLIGRLLHDTHMIYEDQLAAIEKDSARVGTTGDQIDLALLVDGLQAEREQGITIDVAYRFFSTDQRKFIIADTPGHEQYTRNMVTGASNSDLAIILMDARKGVLPQTKRHSFISHLLGIKHIVVAVNKMDLVDYDEATFEQLQADYRSFSGMLGIQEPVFIPMSALDGDNVATQSANMPWYKGPCLLSYLEDVTIETGRNFDEFRFPVQYVNRPHLNFRGFSGTVASGKVSPGDAVKVLPSGLTSQVKSIVTMDGDLDKAFTPMAVTLTLEDEIDISRGDILVPADDSAILSDQLEVTLVWMEEQALTPGSKYLIKIAGKTTVARVETLDYKTNVNTLRSEPTDRLQLNEIGRCRLRLDTPVLVDAYTQHRYTGALILIDRLTNATVSAGMVIGSAASLDDQVDLSRQVTLKERNLRMGQLSATVVLSADTQKEAEEIAFALERKLFQQGRSVAVIGSEFLAAGEETLNVFVIADVLERVGKICIIPVTESDLISPTTKLNILSVDIREASSSNAMLRINSALSLHEQVAAIETSLQDHIRL